MPQNIDSDKKQWVSLLAANTPEEIRNVAAMSEEFFNIIAEISEFVQDVGKVMNMFSEALYMLDRNTEELMYNEAIQELNDAQKKLEEKERMLEEQQQTMKEQQQAMKEQQQAMEEQQQAMEEQQQAMEEQQQANEALKKQAEKEKMEKIQLCIQMSSSKEAAFQNLWKRFQIEHEEAAKYMNLFWDEN
jgi:DNA repair ATPase RecN